MKGIDLKKIIFMDYLIKHRMTGNPKTFAKKLEISRSTFFEYLNYLRNELSLDIKYDKYQPSYYYDGNDLSSWFKTNTSIFSI